MPIADIQTQGNVMKKKARMSALRDVAEVAWDERSTVVGASYEEMGRA